MPAGALPAGALTIPIWHGSLGLKAGAGSTAELLFTTCLRIARRAVAGLLEDLTGGATHYHDRSTLPDWTSRTGDGGGDRKPAVLQGPPRR